MGKNIMETALSHYQQHAKDYVPDIYKAKEAELSQQILVDIYRVFEKQLAMYKKDSQEKIQKIFDRLTIKKDNLEDFNANLKKLNSEFMNQNTAFLQSCIVFPQAWDMELVSQGLTEQLQQ